MPSDALDVDRATVRLRQPRSEEAQALRGSEGEVAESTRVAESLAHLFVDEDTHVDRYRTLSILGRGGMGEVARARDERIGREVALKLMIEPPPQMQREATERFLREARVQALLEHPSIVPVYEIGNDPCGLPFFTMKRIHGCTLFEILAQQQAPAISGKALVTVSRNKLLRAFVTVCEALDYAHSRGVVHRDLKPDNIMLGLYGEVYVLDWGVAKLMRLDQDEVTPDEEPRATQPGEMVGTPGYMSPEQIVNIDNDVDERSDVFALGCILFELLAGRPLFAGPSTGAILQETLSPSRVTPSIADAPPELCALVDRATRFRPVDRNTTARDLARAVESFLDGDRDMALRTKLAEERAEAARGYADSALSQSKSDNEKYRSLAMHEAGQALALAPDNLSARRVILGLFATPPSVLPKEVRAEEADLFAGHLKTILRGSVARVVAWFPLFGFLFLMGVRRIELVVGVAALMVGILAASLMLLKTQRYAPGFRLAIFIAVLCHAVLLSFVFGPLVFVPGFVATTTMLFVAQAPRKYRALALVLGCLTIVGPLVLELSGVLAPSMAVTTDAISLLPRMTSFKEGYALVALLMVSVLGVVTPALLAGKMRDELLTAERDLLFQKWQLAQLLPRDTAPTRLQSTLKRAVP